MARFLSASLDGRQQIGNGDGDDADDRDDDEQFDEREALKLPRHSLTSLAPRPVTDDSKTSAKEENACLAEFEVNPFMDCRGLRKGATECHFEVRRVMRMISEGRKSRMGGPPGARAPAHKKGSYGPHRSSLDAGVGQSDQPSERATPGRRGCDRKA